MGVQAGSTATEASNSSKHSITQHYDDQTPRIDAPDAAAIPSPNLLVKLSKAVPGKIVGSYTTKVIAGSMIGVGALFLLSGYGAVVAIPLIASGGALWLASTTVSLADIEGKDATSVILHLVKSVGSLVGGAALSFLFTFIIPGTAALISGAFIAIPTSGIALTLGSFGLDYKNLGKNPTFAKVMHSDIRTHLSKKGGGFYENPPDVESALAYIRQGNNPTNVFLRYLDTVRAQKRTENPQDLDKLIETKGFSFKNLKLKNTDLKGIHFENLKIVNVDFSGSDFTYSKLTDCTFVNCNLEKCIFDTAELLNCKFERCYLNSTDFADAICEDVQTIDCYDRRFYHEFAFNVVTNPDLSSTICHGRQSFLLIALNDIYTNYEKFGARTKARAAYDILFLDDNINGPYTWELKIKVASDVIREELVYPPELVGPAVKIVLANSDKIIKSVVEIAKRLSLDHDQLNASCNVIKSWEELVDEWG